MTEVLIVLGVWLVLGYFAVLIFNTNARIESEFDPIYKWTEILGCIAFGPFALFVSIFMLIGCAWDRYKRNRRRKGLPVGPTGLGAMFFNIKQNPVQPPSGRYINPRNPSGPGVNWDEYQELKENS